MKPGGLKERVQEAMIRFDSGSVRQTDSRDCAVCLSETGLLSVSGLTAPAALTQHTYLTSVTLINNQSINRFVIISYESSQRTCDAAARHCVINTDLIDLIYVINCY